MLPLVDNTAHFKLCLVLVKRIDIVQIKEALFTTLHVYGIYSKTNDGT